MKTEEEVRPGKQCYSPKHAVAFPASTCGGAGVQKSQQGPYRSPSKAGPLESGFHSVQPLW